MVIHQYYHQEGWTITRVTTKGQVTIPADVRAAAGIVPGAELEWSYDPVRRCLIATTPRHPIDESESIEDRIASLRGSVKTDLTTDQIMAMFRGDEEE